MNTPKTPMNTTKRPAWNRGRVIGQKRALLPKHVWAIRARLKFDENYRDLALFNMAVDSKLRGCDLVCIKLSDVFFTGKIRERTLILQRKTDKHVQFEITEATRQSLRDWINYSGINSRDFLWPSRFHANDHISTRQYARLIKEWVASIGLEPSAYGTHSLRRTKASQIYKKTGNLRAVQLLLGHTKIDNTARYLGLELEDVLAISENVEI